MFPTLPNAIMTKQQSKMKKQIGLLGGYISPGRHHGCYPLRMLWKWIVKGSLRKHVLVDHDSFSRCAIPSAFVLVCQRWADHEVNLYVHHDCSGQSWPIYQHLRAWFLCWYCWNYPRESVTGVSERLKRHSQIARKDRGGDFFAHMQESLWC